MGFLADLFGKNQPSAPAAPDYRGAAQAQGAANVDTARLQARMSNPNIFGPLGNQTVSFLPDDSVAIFQTLNPAAQDTLNAQQRVQRSLAGLGEQGIGTASQKLSEGFNPNLPGIQTGIGNAGQIPQTPDLSSYGQASGLSSMLSSLPKQLPKSYTNPSDFEGLTFAPAGSSLQDLINNRPMNHYVPGTSREQQLRIEAPYMTRDNYERQLNDLRLNQAIDVKSQMQQPGAQPFVQQTPQAPELSVYGMAGSNVNAQPVNQGPQAGQYGMAGAGPSAGQYGFAGGLNTSNVAAMPVNAGMTGQQAIMNRLAPQLERADAATRQRLVNQGLVPGGEAYENAMISQNQQKNDLLSQAALQGIGLDTAANAQGFGQALQAGQFGNQAVAQNFGQGQAANVAANQAVGQNFNQGLAAQQAQNAAAQQLYNQNMGVQGLQNQAIGQNQQTALAQYQAQLGGQQQGFGQQVTQRQLGNQAISQNQQTALAQQQAALAAQNQQYNQLLQGAQFGNTAQQQSLAQQLQLRNQPLNEIIGLMGGSQIQMPQFQGYQGSNIAPAPIFAGAQAAGQSAMQNYGIQQSGANAQNAGLYGLLGAGAGAYGMMNRG
jgi:hypothetical protein